MENKNGVINSWLETEKEISYKIKNGVINEATRRERDPEKLFSSLTPESPTLKVTSASDGAILNMCYAVKSVLSVLNFGELDEITVRDKEFVRRGITALVDYYESDENTFNQITELNYEYWADTFGSSEVYINRTMVAVFVTFIYFRRAVKRKALFDIDNPEIKSLTERMAKIMRVIISKWLSEVKRNKFEGWGFMTTSTETNLADTYKVVEAISKYQDAFDQTGEKADPDFMALIDGEDNYTERIEDAMYRVALNVYDDTKKDCYGEGVFYKVSDYTGSYSGSQKYKRSDMEQLLSSNRSSALFQPLYVAMITMYGYTDKEVVIRKFMTSHTETKETYEKICAELSSDLDIEERSADLSGLTEVYESLELIVREHKPISELSEEEYKALYDEARKLEKALERYALAEMKTHVKEYRDYLNKTKDAIDNVQVYYRKFQDLQKLGIVDTDYTIFSGRDLKAGQVEISRLNKSNIVTAYLRPLLLTAKTMIVNALIKYPQADMEALFVDIINSVYTKSRSKKEFIWNEEEKNLFATSVNCDTITYDYFDYYSKYELNYRTMSKIYQETQQYLKEKFALTEKGTPDLEEAKAEVAEKVGLGDSETVKVTVNAIFDVAGEQIKALKNEYDSQLAQREKSSDKERAEYERDKARIAEEREKERLQYREERAELEENTKVATVIEELINNKLEMYFDDLLGSITLLNFTDTETLTPDFIEKASREDSPLPELAKARAKKYKKQLKALALDSEESGHRQETVYLRRESERLRALRDSFAISFDGVLDNVISNFGGSLEQKMNDYKAFSSEMNVFKRNWFERTVKEQSGKSMKHLFTAADQQKIYILTPQKPEENKE